MPRLARKTAWDGVTAKTVSVAHLRALADGDIPFLRVARFLEPRWCRTIASRFWDSEPPPYRRFEHGPSRVAQVGAALGPLSPDLERYLAMAAERGPALRALYAGGEDPFTKVSAALARATGWNVLAARDRGRGYATDILWALLPGSWSVLHCDASRASRALFISRFSRQLSWDVYITVPEKGGEMIVYRRSWRPEDEAARLADGREMDARLVAGCDRAEIHAEPGDLILFNSDHYHHAARTEGKTPRMTAHSFIGLSFEAEELAFWA